MQNLIKVYNNFPEEIRYLIDQEVEKIKIPEVNVKFNSETMKFEVIQTDKKETSESQDIKETPVLIIPRSIPTPTKFTSDISHGGRTEISEKKWVETLKERIHEDYYVNKGAPYYYDKYEKIVEHDDNVFEAKTYRESLESKINIGDPIRLCNGGYMTPN